MKTIKFTNAEWRELALTFKPKVDFDAVMRERFGLIRVMCRDDIFGHYYKVVNEQKYLMFLLEWP